MKVLSIITLISIMTMSYASAATQAINCTGNGVSLRASFSIGQYNPAYARMSAKIPNVTGALKVVEYRTLRSGNSSLKLPTIQIFGLTNKGDSVGVEIPLSAAGQRGTIMGMVDYQPSLVDEGFYFIPVKCTSEVR